ncbi:ATP-binding cassette domain-containing protein [Rhizobium sp. KVB221]|uniref:ATP-binding cassette domain-containing protein n=1 Tax=Rhizobium setariae TaxID=2801340 RepID=A0A937CNE4_9HYPH|nr:ATP-binding cassette domain-containing protein [Rhizobium setariae]MBL0371904.1 ATP-binding cassette domain-containing protein [Rhizobium setariae]
MGVNFVLKATGLCKAYGALRVTTDVSLCLSPGEALGIIGPNGAGKTTLLNLLTGTVRADRGRVFFKGTDITSVNPRKRCRMGITRSFQVPQPFAGMTVFENTLVAATYGQGLTEAKAREHAADALQRTGLWKKATVRAGEIGLLDRKRLELARSIATAPKLLLLDEIAGGLTEAECRELIELILAIKSEDVSIVWIEHVLHALLSVVDRVMLLDLGRKVAEGDPHAILRSPEVAAVYLGLELDAAHG